MPTADGLSGAPDAPRVGRLISSDSIPAGGFTPGAILADRYRIIGLLGRGGMGEVYRADDLKLGQPVALKFLPRQLAADAVRRERFFAEVRITRQLAHPNICRVYDIAEFDGQHFLSMEFIDGEDLASLIQRIGYLSNEKALDIARQLAAGLAAAHDRGVLHRDLKPANIMIDGHGRVRITDFGLAVAADDETQAAEIFGTPAYMAPEQLARKGASVRSDIYSLGLVLYEICTGKRAFTSSTLAELRQQKETHTITAPSEIRATVDPIVERLIMRCLDRDPNLRPASATQLALALPGGDPLAAAIAAGETPSPEMLAASSSKEGVRPAIAFALAVVFVVATFVAVWLNDRKSLLGHVPLTKPREVLIERAREFIVKAGYTRETADSAFGFSSNADLLEYLRTTRTSGRWDGVDALSPIHFWYRDSPGPLEHAMLPFLQLTTSNPPLRYSGEVIVLLDGEGRLRHFRAMPPPRDSSPGSSTAPDWNMLFTEAGLDISQWNSAEPLWNPTEYADTRAAWLGTLPNATDVPVRIEAAAYRGKPISFRIVGPWTPTGESTPPPIGAGATIRRVIVGVVFSIVIGGGLVLARRNLRLGRGDRRGAKRLAIFVITSTAIAWIVGEHHVATPWEIRLAIGFVAYSFLVAATAWTAYIALEPFVRRRWPHILVSWTRLLSGEWRDPLVGRDVLIGCAIGAVGRTLLDLGRLAPSWVGYPEPVPASNGLTPLVSVSSFIAFLDALSFTSIIEVSAFLLVVYIARMVLRKDWLAVGFPAMLFAALILFSASRSAAEIPWVVAPFALVVAAMVFGGLMRFGFLAIVVADFFQNVLNNFPLTLQTSAWYANIGYAALFILGFIMLYGLRTSLGNRPFGNAAVFED